MSDNTEVSNDVVISRAKYCVTHPRLRKIDNFGFVYDMNDYCGCGKQYKEHDYWKEWMSKHEL